MRRVRKYAALLLALVLAAGLGGCQLALEEAAVSRDRFVGLSVLISDGMSHSVKDGEYFDRFQPHEVDGELLISRRWTDENGEEHIGDEYGEWFDATKSGVHVKDDSVEHTVESTLYLYEEILPPGVLLICERVYQREDGTLYAVSGGHNYSGQLDGVGLAISESYTTIDANGKQISEKTTIKLNVKYEACVLSAEAVEMSGTDGEIARHELTGQDEVWISPEAEWVMVEEKLNDGTIRRTAVNGPLNRAYFTIRKSDYQGVCIPHTYTLRVPGALSDETNPS